MPVKKTEQSQWVAAALALLDGAGVEDFAPPEWRPGVGRSLLEVGLDEIVALVAEMNNLDDLSKGSFYNHFPGKLLGLYRAAIAAYQAGREQALQNTQVTVIQNPVDALRVLRSWAEQTAVRDESMGRWASAAGAGWDGAAEAAAALDAISQAALPILTATLVRLGMPKGMAGTLARVVAAEFGCGRGPMMIRPGDHAGFSHLMRGIAHIAAAERPPELEMSRVPTAAGEVTVFIVPTPGMDPETQLAAARELAVRVAGSEPAAAAPARRRPRRAQGGRT